MPEVKIGDRVLLKCFNGVYGVKGNYCGWVNGFMHHVGKEVVVTGLSSKGNIMAKELGIYRWSKNYVEIVSTSYPNPPHKHAEIIKAWADGAAIEYFHDEWINLVGMNPVWDTDVSYRVKPQKTEREIEIERIESEMRKLADSLKELKNADD